MTRGRSQEGCFEHLGDRGADVPDQNRQCRKDKRDDRQFHMRRYVTELLEPRKILEADRCHSSRGKPSTTHCQNQQAECKHKVGNNEKCRGCPRKRTIWGAPESCGAPDSEGKSERQANNVAKTVSSKVFRARTQSSGATGVL